MGDKCPGRRAAGQGPDSVPLARSSGSMLMTRRSSSLWRRIKSRTRPSTTRPVSMRTTGCGSEPTMPRSYDPACWHQPGNGGGFPAPLTVT